MGFEDRFSGLAHVYAQHRPQYPEALFHYLAGISPGRDLAWDCGTGNGQAAVGLASYFERVVATDASANQIANATPHPKLTYRVSPAEHTNLASSTVDVVTVAQALHWFDLDRFYAEVRRVLKPGGILAAWCYNWVEIERTIDTILKHYYYDVVGPYWSPRLRLVEEGYRTVAFPFEELPPPQMTQEALYDLEDLIGYLNSWSAAQAYAQVRGTDPLNEIRGELTRAWGEPSYKRLARWPLHFRIGRVPAGEAQKG